VSGGDKEERANLVTPECESGRVLLPNRAPWLFDFTEEIHAFPKAPYDDWADSMTGALQHIQTMPMSGGLTLVPRAERRAGLL